MCSFFLSFFENISPLVLFFVDFCLPLHSQLGRNSAGCSSARLEYASGGRVVAGSNPVIPTDEKALQVFVEPVLFLFNGRLPVTPFRINVKF